MLWIHEKLKADMEKEIHFQANTFLVWMILMLRTANKPFYLKLLNEIENA